MIRGQCRVNDPRMLHDNQCLLVYIQAIIACLFPYLDPVDGKHCGIVWGFVSRDIFCDALDASQLPFVYLLLCGAIYTSPSFTSRSSTSFQDVKVTLLFTIWSAVLLWWRVTVLISCFFFKQWEEDFLDIFYGIMWMNPCLLLFLWGFWVRYNAPGDLEYPKSGNICCIM